MDFALSPDQAAILESVRDWVRAELAPQMIAIDEGGKHPWAQQHTLGEMGVWGALFPEEYGGAGLDFLTYILLLEEVSYGCFNTGLAMSVHTMSGTAIAKFGTEEQKAHWLPDLASGQKLIAFCLSEPDAGSDAASLKCRAVRNGDMYVLNGTKAWISFGGDAHLYLVYAVTTPDLPGGKGISAFLVDPDTPGLTWGEDEKKMGGNALANRQMHLTDARVPASALLGDEGQGFKIAMAGLNGGRIGVA
ncbi:MAG TPA: acyl-CoA dehydrogenase family protein, partial [bacterium]|nr:acyl-CoA dehydrogenase family protein [bacterium]